MDQSRSFGLWAGWIAGISLSVSCATLSAQPVSYDFNNDGTGDFPVSLTGLDVLDPVTGAVRVWSGASKTVLMTIPSTSTNSLFGWSYASAGDINQDGADDLIVGEPLYDDNGDLAGRVTVFSGLDSTVLLTVDGLHVESGFGRFVAGIGDWNGDGTPDIAVSGWDIADLDGNGLGDDAIGEVYIISGSNGRVLTHIMEPSADQWFGYSVFGLGDITGDGFSDIAVVDRGFENVPGSGIKGAVYIFNGGMYIPSLDISGASQTIINTDSGIRGFASQIDTMHPDLWLPEPLLQVISLTNTGTASVNDSEIKIDILKSNGTLSGTKGTRTSLKLAGDINLDGKVNSLDILDSISQLGTDPQAIGVMPIADSNNDNIIDMLDIQVVIDGYGQTTDIYEGLWDGERLLSVPAGAAGFGSTTALGPIGGSTGGTQGPGPRPSDDCLRLIDPTSPFFEITPLPWYLLLESQESCSDCPDYEDNPACYECDKDKTVSGGSVTADPDQPFTNEAVTFTASGVRENPGTLICEIGCGDDGITVPTPLGDPSYVWALLIKDPVTGWPDEPDPELGTVGWPAGDTYIYPSGAGEACQDIKAICWATPSLPCQPNDPTWTKVGEKTVKFADFEIVLDPQFDSAEYRDANPNEPVGSQESRLIYGVGEKLNAMAFDDQGNPVTVTWEAEIDGQTFSGGTTSNVELTMLDYKHTVVITATSGGCSRSTTIKIVEPTFSYGDPATNPQFLKLHDKDIASNGICSVIYAHPLSVSFQNVIMAETVGVMYHNGDFFSVVFGPSHCGADTNEPIGTCDQLVKMDFRNQARDELFGITIRRDAAYTGHVTPFFNPPLYDDNSQLFAIYGAAYKTATGSWRVSTAPGNQVIQAHWISDVYGTVHSYKNGLQSQSAIGDETSGPCN